MKTRVLSAQVASANYAMLWFAVAAAAVAMVVFGN